MASEKFRIDKARWHSEVETLALAQKGAGPLPGICDQKRNFSRCRGLLSGTARRLPDLGEVVSVRGPHDDAAKSKPSSRFFARYDGSINAPRRSDNRAPIFRMDLPRLVRRAKLTGEIG